jgi:lipocalin-like protein
MRVRAALIAVACAILATSSTHAQNGSIVGTSRLVAIEGVGRGTAPDDHPYGIITYDNTGHMAVQMAYRSARPVSAAGGTEKEKADLLDTYGAYFGTYEVDTTRGVVTHHIEGSLAPRDVGMNLVRYYEMRGNQVLYFVAEDGRGGVYPTKEATVRRIIWERINAK